MTAAVLADILLMKMLRLTTVPPRRTVATSALLFFLITGMTGCVNTVEPEETCEAFLSRIEENPTDPRSNIQPFSDSAPVTGNIEQTRQRLLDRIAFLREHVLSGIEAQHGCPPDRVEMIKATAS